MIKKSNLTQIFNQKKNGLDGFRKSMSENQKCCIYVGKTLYAYTPGIIGCFSGSLTKQDGNKLYEYNQNTKLWNEIL